MAKKAPTKKSFGKKPSSRKKYTFNVKDAEGRHLVIVESPTKAKTINKYLGRGYHVMASVGHVRDLPKSAPKGSSKEDQVLPGVDLARNFEPTYEILPDKKDTVANLRKAAKVATDVYFATDLDREGEAIAWHLAEALKVPTHQAKRVVFNAITKSALEAAFASPRGIAVPRVDAQQTRRILDRIVGYQVSPLLWRKVAGGLSAGRVQSVATRLVVERERAIEAHVPEESWKLTGFFTPEMEKAGKLGDAWRKFLKESGEDVTIKDQNGFLSEHGVLRAELDTVGGKKWKTDDRQQALELAEALGFVLDDAVETEHPDEKGPAKNQVCFLGTIGNAPAYAIDSVETKRTKRRPAPPFITSTLQQRASSYLSFNLKRTMRVAQQLYEGIDLKGSRGQTGLITYMRTDSTHLAGEAVAAARTYIENKLGKEYRPEDKPRFYKSANQDAQEAHEAIRPTDVTITPSEIRNQLSEEQFRLYDLIWRRFVACQMVDAEFDSTSIVIRCEKADATFRASGSVMVFDGFMRISGVPKSDEVLLPKGLVAKKPVAPIDLDPRQQFSSPPARFTEASLQKELEKEGIGRPSTYAAIIGTIQDRKYVETVNARDKRLMATDLGKVVNDKLIEAFPGILDVGYTREMESQLDEIENGGRDWRKTLSDFYRPFKVQLDDAMANMTHAKAATEVSEHRCPTCGSPCEYRLGKNGRFLSCTAFNVPPLEVKPEGHPTAPDGSPWLLHKAKGRARPKITTAEGDVKLGWTKLTKDDKERFMNLSEQMPEPCKYAAPIDRDGKPQAPELTDVLCPVDGEPMIQRTGRFGPFLASSNYPQVQYILKLHPKTGAVVTPKVEPLTTEKVCPKCEERPLYLRDGKHGLWLSCSGFPKCRGRESFGGLDEEEQKDLQKQWDAHVKANPLPEVRTADGRVLQDEDNYVPRLLEDVA